MPLNISSSGDFVPFLKFDSKSGRFKVRPEGTDKWVEISNFNLAFDMEHIRTGWIWFPQDGGPPHKQWSASVSSDIGPRPGPDYKMGFEVAVFGNMPIPGTQTPIGLRTWSSNAGVTVSAINEMYAEYEAQLPQHPGQLPVYALQGVREIDGTYGALYKPVFKLAVWVNKDKAPALADYSSHRQQVLPPPAPQQPRRIAAMPSNGNGNQLQVEQRGSYEVSSMKPVGQTSVVQRARQIAEEGNDFPSDEIPF